jgi:hypothetical protein
VLDEPIHLEPYQHEWVEAFRLEQKCLATNLGVGDRCYRAHVLSASEIAAPGRCITVRANGHRSRDPHAADWRFNMVKGLGTVVYPVTDLNGAKTWYSTAFQQKPYFDEPFYVGFIAGYEL